MSGVPVRLSRDGACLRLVLDRPDAGNAIDQAVAEAFADAVAELESLPGSIVVLESTGRVFCAGGDIAAMTAAADSGRYLRRLAETMNAALERLRESEHVVIARVQGAAAGAGLALVLHADLAVASSRASFRTAYAAIGLTPDCGTSRLLPAAVGIRRATDLAVTGRVLSAEEALDWGVVHRVCQPDELDAQVAVLAAALAEAPAGTAADTIRLLRRDEGSLAEHMALEAVEISRRVTGEEARSRIAAFLGRR